MIQELDTWQEPMPLYAQPGAITASLADSLDTTPISRSDVSIVGIGLIGGILIGIGLLVFGYQIGYVAGMLQPWYDMRGWGALLVFAVVLAAVTIRERNAR